jgi:outer membrane biosynthesis protein TonB
VSGRIEIDLAPTPRIAPSGRLGELDPKRVPSPLAHLTARDLYALHGGQSSRSVHASSGLATSADPDGSPKGAVVKFLLAVAIVAAAAIGTTFLDTVFHSSPAVEKAVESQAVVPAPPPVVAEPAPEPGLDVPIDEAAATVAEPEVLEPTPPVEPVVKPAAKPAAKPTAKPVTKPAVKPVVKPPVRPRRVLSAAEREDRAKEAEKARKKRLKEQEKARKERGKNSRRN